MKKRAVIIGAGPAGLTAAYELVTKGGGDWEIGVLAPETPVLDSVLLRVKKACPAYFGTYAEFGEVRRWLDGFKNLYCIGRNGQHRYNNMDHSMLCGVEAARALLSGSGKEAVWNVNTEEEYHESK